MDFHIFICEKNSNNLSSFFKFLEYALSLLHKLKLSDRILKRIGGTKMTTEELIEKLELIQKLKCENINT